jgi:hypothetical protein
MGKTTVNTSTTYASVFQRVIITLYGLYCTSCKDIYERIAFSNLRLRDPIYTSATPAQ